MVESETDRLRKALDFQGSLEEFHIPDIIQFLGGAGKTGVLRLKSNHREGVIYLQGGRITHATYEDIVGEEAVYSLLLLSSGNFDFEPGVSAEASTVTRSNTNLLIEAARRKDEWKVISEKISNLNWVPEFVVPGQEDTGKQITLNTSEWIILSKIDGERNVKAIAKACRLSIFQTCRLLYSLVSTGLIRLRKPGPSGEEVVQFPG